MLEALTDAELARALPPLDEDLAARSAAPGRGVERLKRLSGERERTTERERLNGDTGELRAAQRRERAGTTRDASLRLAARRSRASPLAAPAPRSPARRSPFPSLRRSPLAERHLDLHSVFSNECLLKHLAGFALEVSRRRASSARKSA